MCIRTSANTATSQIRAQYRDQEKEVNDNINRLIETLASIGEDDPQREVISALLDDQRHVKRDLVQKIGSALEMKTAKKWYNEGELSNKYFLNLLRRNGNSEINTVNCNGNLITDPKLIEEAVGSFYRKLYQDDTGNIIINDDNIFRNIDCVSANEARETINPITEEELHNILCSSSDSAPGPDGIPYSYLKHHWRHIGKLIVDAWNYSLQYGKLAPSHEVSFLRLIPKPGKDLSVISNWRPITLSNCDHKLITKVYSKRRTKALDSKIGHEQTAYIPGRLINDNIRSMLMTID